MDFWTIVWLAWLAFGGAWEIAALINRAEGDTLSEHIWRWFSIRGQGPAWQLRRVALLLGMTWLTVHFLTGGWL